MAKVLLFSVRDSASEAFGRPVGAVATGQAVRSFTDEVNANRDGNAMADHPEDFELWFIGEYEDSTGRVFQTPDGPSLVVRGKDVRRQS